MVYIYIYWILNKYHINAIDLNLFHYILKTHISYSMIMETTLALLSSIARTSRTNEFNPILSCNKGFPTVRWFDEIDCYLIEQLIASNNMQCLNPTWAYQYQIWKLINNKTYQLVGTLPSRCISVRPSRSGTTVLLQNIFSIDIQIDCPKQQMFSPYIEVDSSWTLYMS